MRIYQPETKKNNDSIQTKQTSAVRGTICCWRSSKLTGSSLHLQYYTRITYHRFDHGLSKKTPFSYETNTQAHNESHDQTDCCYDSLRTDCQNNKMNNKNSRPKVHKYNLCVSMLENVLNLIE